MIYDFYYIIVFVSAAAVSLLVSAAAVSLFVSAAAVSYIQTHTAALSFLRPHSMP